jgi:hypothetical protein
MGGESWVVGCRPLRGLRTLLFFRILGLAPQALCFRPLRGLGSSVRNDLTNSFAFLIYPLCIVITLMHSDYLTY